MSENKNSDIIKQEAQAEKNSTFEEFNENTLRVRRNLLIFSVIALFYKLSGATLTGKSSFLGLEFEHIDPEMIDLFLLWIVGYHLIHFIWLASEHTHHYIINSMSSMATENKEVNLFPSTKKIVEKMKKENEQLKIKNSEVHKKNLEQAKKEYEQFKITNSEMDRKIENAENYIKENATKLEIFKNKFEAIEIKMKELESFINKFKVRLIIINKWRYYLMETYLPSLIGFFAFLVLVL